MVRLNFSKRYFSRRGLEKHLAKEDVIFSITLKVLLLKIRQKSISHGTTFQHHV